jgi:hypothetical protein
MFSYAPPLSGVPTGTLDMTAAVTPLFPEIMVGVGLGILMLAFFTAIYDIWWTQRQMQQLQQPTSEEETESLPKAA